MIFLVNCGSLRNAGIGIAESGVGVAEEASALVSLWWCI
jgi:hypothetical protein